LAIEALQVQRELQETKANKVQPELQVGSDQMDAVEILVRMVLKELVDLEAGRARLVTEAYLARLGLWVNQETVANEVLMATRDQLESLDLLAHEAVLDSGVLMARQVTLGNLGYKEAKEWEVSVVMLATKACEEQRVQLVLKVSRDPKESLGLRV
jgi:hypothetical protein